MGERKKKEKKETRVETENSFCMFFKFSSFYRILSEGYNFEIARNSNVFFSDKKNAVIRILMKVILQNCIIYRICRF